MLHQSPSAPKFKRSAITALVLAGAMVMGMSFAAFAADGDTPNRNYNGTAEGDNKLAVLSDATEIELTKDIVLYNAETEKIYAPNVTYTYAVASAGTTANSVDITGIILGDTNNPHKTTTVTVRDGISGGVKLSATSGGTGADSVDVVFANGDDLDSATPLKEGVGATTSNAGAAKTRKSFYIEIDPAAIYNSGANPAGIYRYKITDNTTRATLAAAGILRDDNYDASYKTLYLDVYLKNKYVDNDPSKAINGLAVYGHVLFKAGTADTEFQYVSGSTETYKLTGFNVDSELGSGTTVISDQYHTYNLNVTKEITGALADKNNFFPFEITLAEAAGNTATKVYVTHANSKDVKDGSDSGISTGNGTTLAAGATSNTFTGKLKNDGNIKFIGIPSYITYNASTGAYESTTYATANAEETNNTYDTYVASAIVDTESSKSTINYKKTLSDAAATGTDVVIANSGTAKLDTALTVDGKKADGTTVIGNAIAFTNTLDAISPTGVAMRVAPYVLMLGAGLFLLLVTRRREEE